MKSFFALATAFVLVIASPAMPNLPPGPDEPLAHPTGTPKTVYPRPHHSPILPEGPVSDDAIRPNQSIYLYNELSPKLVASISKSGGPLVFDRPGDATHLHKPKDVRLSKGTDRDYGLIQFSAPQQNPFCLTTASAPRAIVADCNRTDHQQLWFVSGDPLQPIHNLQGQCLAFIPSGKVKSPCANSSISIHACKDLGKHQKGWHWNVTLAK